MTIYSGFPTRKLEQRYNDLITQTIQMLSQIIITYVERSKIQPFQRQFRKLYTNIQKMDAMKHLQPKYSNTLKPISEHILFFNQMPQTVPENLIINQQNQSKKRPMTSNNFTQQRRHSIQFERKTINIVDQKNRMLVHRYDKPYKNKARNQSFSVKHSGNYAGYKQDKQLQVEIPINITMEQLMEKNRFIQRKMTLFRKKKQLPQPSKIAKIPQLEQEQEASFM